MTRKVCKTSLIIIFLVLVSFLFAQDDGPIRRPVINGTGAASLTAFEEFRFGVQAFHRFAYNEAILSFERALSFLPAEPLIHDWLGRAYYRSGMEEIALRQWHSALDLYGRNTGEGMLLASRIETVANRRSWFPIIDDEIRYIERGRYPGRFEDITLYRQPTSLLPNSDGSVWAVAYGSNELVRIDVNGVIRDRRRGPFNGFDRPYDIARGRDGRLYVSEFHGGRVSILNSRGDWQAYIGSRGLGDGQFVGPSHMTIDEDGYLYVVDYGNMRVSKFDPDGVFIVSFGRRGFGFSGLLSPTGIAAANGIIYVADNAARAIYMFDPNGTYLGELAVEGLRVPESLRFLPNGLLLAADTNRILLIEVESAIVREIGIAGNERVRITCADMDSNGNILAAKFRENEIAVMIRSDDIASGLFVQIRNVHVERFPSVTVEFTVEDRFRRPITGLDINNFYLTENGNIAANQRFLTPGHRLPGSDISLLVERSDLTMRLQDDLIAASRDISRTLQSMNNARIVSVIGAGTQPRREQHDVSLENALRGTIASFTPRWRFDLGLRLSATDLLGGAAKRSVVYIGSGDTGELAFEQYSLSEMAAYLANNNIVFNAIIIGNSQASPAIEFLCIETGGRAMHLFRPQGIDELIRSIADIPSPLYSFNYISQLPTDFGREYLQVEVEAYLLERSGRDNIGYFPPLE